MASIVRYGETPETSFNQWAWNLILRLKLHKNDYGIQQNCAGPEETKIGLGEGRERCRKETPGLVVWNSGAVGDRTNISVMKGASE